jgi:signal transduction histidine kinase
MTRILFERFAKPHDYRQVFSAGIEIMSLSSRTESPTADYRTGRRRRSPLFFRLFAVMLIVVLTAQAFNFALILILRLPTQQSYALSEVAAALRAEASTSSSLSVATAEPPSDRGQDRRDQRLRALLASQLGVSEDRVRVDISGPPQIFARRTADHSKAEIEASKRLESEPGQRGSDSEIIVGRFAAAIRLPDGQWRVVRPSSQGVEPWQWQVFMGLLGTLSATAPFAWFIARRVAAPVHLFAAAAERLGRDPGAPPLILDGPPEIVSAAAAFNAMQARLKRYVDDRTVMVGAIAHDLATPLMRLNVLIDDMPENIRSVVEAEIKEMRGRIRDTLSFVRGVSHPGHRRQRLSLRSVIESIANEMSDDGADVVIEPCDDVVANADIASLKALLQNLINNAVQYAGRARITLRTDGQYARIDVVDDGPGIPAAELERVFEPFYRGGPSNLRSRGGTGLGLASARTIARAHGGDVVLANRSGGGIVASVSLPLQ